MYLHLFRKKYKALPEATTRSENPKNKTWLLKNNMKSCSNILLKVQFQTTSFTITYTTCKHKIFIGIR